MPIFKIKIDGVETTLTYDCFSDSRGHQYLTPGNRASHAFPFKLTPGMRFRTNGSYYEILSGSL